MSAIDPISRQWTMFQAVGMSPTTVASKYEKLCRNVYIFGMTVLQVYNMFSYTFAIQRQSFAALLSSMLIFGMQELLPIIILVIFVELFIMGHRQDEFLHELSKIDSLLVNQLQIDLKCKMQKRRYTALFKQWFVVVVVARSIAAMVIFYAFKRLERSPFVLVIFYLTVPLRIFQYGMFADMIRWRYELVNQYITDTNAGSDPLETIEVAEQSTSDEETLILQHLRDLRDICHSIHLASQRVSELFPLSLALCILYDFTVIFIASYETFKFAFLTDGNYISIGFTVFYASVSAYNLFTMSSICEAAIQQVIEDSPQLA